MDNPASFLSCLTIQLRPGHPLTEPKLTGSLPTQAMVHLRHHLSVLITQVFQLTDAYPVAGDELVLESALVEQWREVAGVSSLTEWQVQKRAFLMPMARLTVAFDLSLSGTQQALVSPKELIDIPDLVGRMPTAQSRRATQNWLTNSEQPVRTWRQLAQRGRELTKERGFSSKHLEIVQLILHEHGLILSLLK